MSTTQKVLCIVFGVLLLLIAFVMAVDGGSSFLWPLGTGIALVIIAFTPSRN